MATMIYNPGVQVYIETTDKRTRKKTILDVSEDVISGSLVRRSSGVSSLTINLQNSGRKYDYPRPIFMPNDRIIINMKRISWVRVFTGYLNQVPVFAAWPGQISLTASCSLKRLQYFYWDPTVPASLNLVLRAMNLQDKTGTDGVFTNIAMAVLDQVVGWDKANVHLGAIPKQWFDFLVPLAKEVQADADADQQYAQSLATQAGSGATVAGTTSTGTGPVASTAVLNGIQVPATVGKCSDFGGTDDASTAYGHDRMSGGTPPISAAPYYCAMRWNYPGADGATSNAPPSSDYFGPYGANDTTQAKKLVVTNHRTGKVCVVYAADWGPAAWTGRVIDLDPKAMAALSGQTDDVCSIGWATDQTVSPGPVTGNEGYSTPSTNGSKGKSTQTGSGGTPTPDPSSTTTTASGATVGATDCRAFNSIAIDFCAQYPTIRYTEQYGGTEIPIIAANPPPGLDCSSFIQAIVLRCFGSLNIPGTKGGFPRTVGAQIAFAQQNNGGFVSVEQGMKIPGAIMYVGPDQHTEMSMGDGQSTIGSHHTGTYAGIVTSGDSWTGAYLMPGITYTDSNGNQITGAVSPSQAVFGNGAGTAGAGNSTGAGSSQSQNPFVTQVQIPTGKDTIDQLFNGGAPFVVGSVDQSGVQYTGALALYNDTPVYDYINTLINASFRQWCSAPNGDIMAWFPDYFGVWGTAAVMTIEDIELQDFQVSWTDEALVTHEFVVGTLAGTIDPGTGDVGGTPEPAFTTHGIASIDMKSLFNAMLGQKMTPADAMAFSQYIETRFGARPNAEQINGIMSYSKAEFFMAVFKFMRYWANQYTAQVPMTFMPELWPGMLIRLPSYGFQAYVEQVQHDWQFGQGGSFNTTATISSPSNVGKNPLLYGLPSMPDFNTAVPYTSITNNTNALAFLPPSVKASLNQDQ